VSRDCVSSSCCRQDALLHTSSRGSDGEAHVDVASVAGVETLAASSLSDVGFSEHDDLVEGDQDKEGHDRLAAPPSAREDGGRRVRGRGFASL
jgi:hypothetical protein